MTVPTDDELVARCKKELPGNTRSYELLVQRHMNRVYSLVYRVVSNKEEAEDITQEVFIKVYHHLRTFEQQASFSSWLYRIATNSALDALDKIKRRPQTTGTLNSGHNDSSGETDALQQVHSPEPGPEERAIQAELRECINRVLKKLDREQARLLVLRDFDDMSYDEIATMLQAGLSAVKMRIHRARLAFQEIFDHLCGKPSLTLSVPAAGEAKLKKGIK
ncbi:MAG: sigma-70 family RNA polymerase sigma factor [Ktedonobacteraceae bacterium]|nr:sigma-70 family RNA polymerase sigma factor [Chloroflexota bacterium]